MRVPTCVVQAEGYLDMRPHGVAFDEGRNELSVRWFGLRVLEPADIAVLSPLVVERFRQAGQELLAEIIRAGSRFREEG